MKKIFRMAMVCALAGATLLYTGCTKDYSEDIASLETRLDQLEGTTIKSLQDQVASLETAKTNLQTALDKANTAIETLNGKVSTLESTASKLRTDLDAAAAQASANATEIAKIKQTLTDVNDEISALKSRISSLESKVPEIESAIKTINETLAKKADKSWVEENYATIKYVDDAIAKVNGELSNIQSSITDIKKDLGTALTDIANLKTDVDALKTWKESAATAISTLQSDMSQAKTDILAAKKAADDAQTTANEALSTANEVKEALKAYYTAKEVDAIVKTLDSTLTARIAALEGRVDKDEDEIASLKELKLDISAYKADTAKVWSKIREIDETIAGVIEAYQAADAALATRIDSLALVTNDLYETKLDKSTFDEFVDEINAKVAALSASIDALLARVQSLTYVPEYADGKIRIPYAMLVPSFVTGDNGNIGGGSGLIPFNSVMQEEPETVNRAIEKTTTVKYRVYGEDAAEIALALVEAYDSLAFDVVKVYPNTRANLEGAELQIVGAEIDDLMSDVLVLTVLPQGLGDTFYMGPQDEETENYSWSVSLVLTDTGEITETEVEGDRKSNVIASCYVNLVPEQRPEMIEVGIYEPDDEGNDVNITYSVADTIEVEYTDTTAKEVLPDATLKFAVGDTLYTYDELLAAGYVVPAPTYSIKDVDDLSGAIDPSKIPEEYFVLAHTDTCISTVALSDIVKEAVGAKDYATTNYTVGNVFVAASQLEIVVPVQVKINSHIWESEAVDTFTWAYAKDAQSDADAYKAEEGAIPTTLRDSAVVKFDSTATKLAAVGLTLADFSRMEPYTCVIKNAAGETVSTYTKAEEETSDVTVAVAPFYNADKTALYAKVSGFDWDEAYTIEAVYNYPTDAQPAVQVTLTSAFETKDRNREPIVITLPTDTVKYAFDFTDTLVNKLGDAVSIEAPIYLSDADLKDAVSKVGLAHADTLVTKLDDEKAVIDETDGPNYIGTDVAGADSVLAHKTYVTVKDDALAGKVLDNTFDYSCSATLWYGQEVKIIKEVVFDTKGIYEYERINEYVKYMNLLNCYTTVQPWWQPDNTAIELDEPLSGYDAHVVNLDQHFRIREVATDSVCTNLDGTIKEAWQFLVREFTLEDPNGTPVESIADPREGEANEVAAATGITMEADQLSYYSMTDSVDVYAGLAITNSNQSLMPLTTRFDVESYMPFNKATEGYQNYVVKKYEPLQELTKRDDVEIEGEGTLESPYMINVNNSIKTVTSIYDFLSLLDKRGHETIDPTTDDGWVIGDDENGFAEGVSVVTLYGLQFTHSMEYVDEVSPETQSRISFDTKTGKLTYDNVLQTQLAEPIRVALSIKIDYVWGQRGYDEEGSIMPIYVEFYNKPVGE